MMRAAFAIMLALAMAAPSSATLQERPADEELLAFQAACAARGGQGMRAGFAATFICVTPYPDGGQRCEDHDDCAGACMAVSPGRGAPLEGRCQVNDNGFGCHQFWERGPGTRLCVD